MSCLSGDDGPITWFLGPHLMLICNCTLYSFFYFFYSLSFLLFYITCIYAFFKSLYTFQLFIFLCYCKGDVSLFLTKKLLLPMGHFTLFVFVCVSFSFLVCVLNFKGLILLQKFSSFLYLLSCGFWLILGKVLIFFFLSYRFP